MRSNSLSTQLKPLPRALKKASARLHLSLPYYTSASQQSTQYVVVVQQAVFIDIFAPVLMPLSLTSRAGSKFHHDSCRKDSLLSSESHEIQSSFQRYNSKTRLQQNIISYTLFDFAIRTAFQPTLREWTGSLTLGFVKFLSNFIGNDSFFFKVLKHLQYELCVYEYQLIISLLIRKDLPFWRSQGLPPSCLDSECLGWPFLSKKLKFTIIQISNH